MGSTNRDPEPDRPAGLTARVRAGDTGLTIRAALLLGFALTVGIWVFTGMYYTRQMASLEVRVADVGARYLKAQDLLSSARNEVIRGSVLVRDALLDAAQPRQRDYRGELTRAYLTAERTLQAYVPVLDSASERERVVSLQQEISALREVTLAVLDVEIRPGTNDASRVLNERIMPRREAAIRVAEELQALNREAFVQHDHEIVEIHQAIQRQVWQILGIALVASLAIGAFGAIYSGRLERRIRRQGEEDARNKRDLQRLSARLVTAQEEERRTIARELHDEVGQVLTAVKVELAVAERAFGSTTPALSEARAITERAIHTVRDLSQLLHPAILDDLGLSEALEWYLKTVRRRHGILVDFSHEPGLGELGHEASVAAYRIVQEALTNVVKHARATRCRVDLARTPTGVRLTIEDDGDGFDVTRVSESSRPKGLGLIGIRERAAHLGGTLRVESERRGGTRLVVDLPIPLASEPASSAREAPQSLALPSET